MSDAPFRTQVTETPEQNLPTGKKQSSSSFADADTPYTNYEEKNAQPFIVDHYELGEYWNKDKAYTLEVTDIDSFIRQKIEKKELANSTEAIKEYFKDLELTVGIKSYDPTSTKLAKLLEYIKTMKN